MDDSIFRTMTNGIKQLVRYPADVFRPQSNSCVVVITASTLGSTRRPIKLTHVFKHVPTWQELCEDVNGARTLKHADESERVVPATQQLQNSTLALQDTGVDGRVECVIFELHPLSEHLTGDGDNHFGIIEFGVHDFDDAEFSLADDAIHRVPVEEVLAISVCVCEKAWL